MKELAAEEIPVAVTCRVLKLARQPYYRRLAQPVVDAEIVEAYRAKSLIDATEVSRQTRTVHKELDQASDLCPSTQVSKPWRSQSPGTDRRTCSARRGHY